MLSLLDPHIAWYQGAGDTRDQGVEQLAQLGRRRCAVEVGFVLLKDIGPIGHEKSEMGGALAPGYQGDVQARSSWVPIADAGE